jgi:phospholipid transport system substrate-binding protein
MKKDIMLKLAKSIPILILALVPARADVARARSADDSANKNEAKAPTPAKPKTTTPQATKAATGTSAPGKAATATTKTAKSGAHAGATTTADDASGRGGPGGGEDKDVAASTPPPASSPMAELKKSNDQLDKLLKKKYPTWSPEGEAQKADVRKVVGGFLDYRELAHRALAKHWESLTVAQRHEFVTTLRELVERSYLKQVRGDPNYNIKYLTEEKTGNEASVEAKLTTMTRGKKVSIALVYKLIYKDRWLVYDVITDEQSMLENYRAEFNKIINKDGFDTLLKRMKKKLDDKDE